MTRKINIHDAISEYSAAPKEVNWSDRLKMSFISVRDTWVVASFSRPFPEAKEQAKKGTFVVRFHNDVTKAEAISRVKEHRDNFWRDNYTQLLGFDLSALDISIPALLSQSWYRVHGDLEDRKITVYPPPTFYKSGPSLILDCRHYPTDLHAIARAFQLRNDDALFLSQLGRRSRVLEKTRTDRSLTIKRAAPSTQPRAVAEYNLPRAVREKLVTELPRFLDLPEHEGIAKTGDGYAFSYPVDLVTKYPRLATEAKDFPLACYFGRLPDIRALLDALLHREESFARVVIGEDDRASLAEKYAISFADQPGNDPFLRSALALTNARDWSAFRFWEKSRTLPGKVHCLAGPDDFGDSSEP